MFAHRSDAPELMDDLQCSGPVVVKTLHEIDFINRKLGGDQVTFQAFKKIVEDIPKETRIKVADLGCGGGGMIRRLTLWAKKQNRSMEFVGIDANPNIVSIAEEENKGLKNVAFETDNILSEEFQNNNYEIILVTLVLHHFTDQELISLVRSLQKKVSHALIINDLHRHWLAYYSIKLLTGLFSKSKMVRYDAPLSVLRGFKRSDLENILSKAGISDYELKWKWAFRWQLIIPASR